MSTVTGGTEVDCKKLVCGDGSMGNIFAPCINVRELKLRNVTYLSKLYNIVLISELRNFLTHSLVI